MNTEITFIKPGFLEDPDNKYNIAQMMTASENPFMLSKNKLITTERGGYRISAYCIANNIDFSVTYTHKYDGHIVPFPAGNEIRR